ncbi:MAG: nucleoside 2-deoxyribosyltransferase [Chloroflexi bacterium]|nr:nucleoside 2-deoxyribosyltransferase [Chloroflexota bacterium]
MNCFVIMPFAKEFDDVYATIKTSVEAVIAPQGGKCFRLDDARPAGSITNRLLQEIQSATICVADVTGNIPNVMWEVGYAMALGKPIILITQKISELPFDIKDMQSLPYERSQLSRTLGTPLQKMVLDTVQLSKTSSSSTNHPQEQNELVGTLMIEIQELKSMVASVVKVWEPSASTQTTPHELSVLEGAWFNKESNTHFYAKIVNGELIGPYCYNGENDSITAVYYNWRRIGEYWFANFAWISGAFTGFAFLKQENLDRFSGAWWTDDNIDTIPDAPPSHAGVPMIWERKKNEKSPSWVVEFFDEVNKNGLQSFLPQKQTKNKRK